MPSVSAKQHRFFEAVAHDPKFAAKVGVPTRVGKDFAAADEGIPKPRASNRGRVPGFGGGKTRSWTGS